MGLMQKSQNPFLLKMRKLNGKELKLQVKLKVNGKGKAKAEAEAEAKVCNETD